MTTVGTQKDAIDVMVAQWAEALPDQDVSSLHTVSRMIRLLRIFENDRTRVLNAVDLEAWGFDVLAALRRQPGGQATSGELMAAVLVTSGTMSTWLKSLEARGWITRTPGQVDRRQVIVSLTVPGRESFDRVFKDVLGCQRRLIACLDPAETDRLTTTLRKMLGQHELTS